MPYVLGIDIGGTTTTAAVSRLGNAGWSAPEVVRLGARTTAVPSVLHVSGDGSLTVGEPVRLDAGRVARGFVRRIGDDVPQIVGGEACTPQALAAVLAMWVVERVLAHEGEPAEQVVVSHPAAWGAYRRELLHRALWEIGLADVTLLPEPVVAAESHTARRFRGRTFGVYSLGGSDYEASVVRWAEGVGFQLLGSAGAIEPFGGADVDEALVGRVRSRLDRDLREVFTRGPQARIALYGLRRECRRVKEELTTAPEAEVVLGTARGQVRVTVTRAELEGLVRPALELSVETLVRLIRSCGLRRRELDGVLLVGGAARMPLVTELLRAALPGPVGVEAEPQSTAAAGAALAAVQVASPPGAWRQDPMSLLQPHLLVGDSHGPGVVRDTRAFQVEQGAMWTPERRAIEASNHEPSPFVREDMESGPPPRPPVDITPLRLRPTQRLFGLVGGQA